MGLMLFFSFSIRFFTSEMLEHQVLEFVWTVLPAFLLLFLAFPSIKALYFSDELMKSNFVLKIIGHQWYWSYEYRNLNLQYDRFIKIERALNKGEWRCLEVSSRIFLFKKIITQLLLTSYDVIHCWTIPRLGVKIDAMPGRLRQTSVFPIYTGLFYGQCSEICGVNHSFMPIKLEVIK